MPRKLRIQYPGAIYHVMNRGDQREDIFHDEQDRLLFLSTLGEACQKTDWQVHVYCLMSNPFPPGYRDAPAQPGRGNEVAAGRIHKTL
jgi:hypothetical protein